MFDHSKTDGVDVSDPRSPTNKCQQSKRICILVLGMHRSGTSAVTRLVSMAGAKLPNELLGVGEGNETGHWEPVQLIKCHDALLADLGSRWDDWRPLELRRLLPRQREAIKASIKGHIEADYGDAALIVIKEPRICRFAPLFLEVLDEAHFDTRVILPIRNPLEVAASLETRANIWSSDQSRTYAGLLWLRHVLDAEAATRGRMRSIVSYDCLLTDWKATFAILSDRLNVAWPYQISDFSPKCDAYISPLQRHHRSSVEDVLLDPHMRGWAAEAFEVLLVLERNPGSQTALAALDRIRREFDISSPMLNRLLVETRGRHADQVNGLQAALGEVEREVGQKSTLLSEREADVGRLTTALTELEREAGQRAALLSERETEVGRLAAASTKAEDRAEIAIADLTASSNEVLRLQTVLAERGAEIARLTTELTSVNARAQTAQADLVAQRNLDVQRLSLALGGTQMQSETLRHEMKALRSSRDQLSHRATLLAFSLKTLVRTRDELEEQISALHNSSSWKYMAPFRKIKLAFLKEPHVVRETRIHKAVRPSNFLESGCLIVSPPHTLHLARLFSQELSNAGFQTSVATDLAMQDAYQHLFVLCPNVFEGIRDGYVAIQMEQTTNARWLTNAYINKLNKASAIIDYSLRNIEFLSTIGIPLQRLFYVPVGTGLPPDIAASGPAEDHVSKDIDILFYGDDQCERRQKILASLKTKFSIRIENNKFGPELWDLIRRSKIVLNIHYYEDALLETVRISESLSFGALVVSETSIDAEQDAAFSSAVAFAQAGDADALAEKISLLLNNTAQYENMMEARGSLVERRGGDFSRYVMRFMLAKQMAGYGSIAGLVQASGDKLLTTDGDGDYPKLCLTLAETPERSQRFRMQDRPEFKLFDGLRHDLGWVGCGLSYRAMLISARARDVDKILICEDDVTFPADYDYRLRVIDKYLEEKAGSWDLFSGFMADISPDTIIADVEERDGVQFIWMDRAVSTVYNIYARRAIETLANWDPENRRVESNTIDRHMQRSPLRIVMAYPFLVEHDERLTSTIWGFENTQYRGMLQQSQETLKKLLIDFELRKQRGIAA